MTEGRDGHLKGGKDERWIDEEDEKVELGKHLKVRRIGHLKGGLGGRKGGLGGRKIYRRKIFWP